MAMLPRFVRFRFVSWSLSQFVPGCRGASSTFPLFASRSPVNPKPGRSKNNLTDPYEEPEHAEPEEEFQALLREEIRRQKAIKFHRVKRQMMPPGPPERQLTWNAICQIRYLKEEFPEEWTVDRLAEGFSVSHDVVARILKSKFIPPLERCAKQNARALATMGQQPSCLEHEPGHHRVGLPGGATATVEPPSSGALTSLPLMSQSGSQSLTAQPVGSTSRSHTLTAQPVRSKSGSHTLTAQPVGSKSGSHTLTAQPVGSKSGSHALTAQPVGSKSGSHTLTAQPVGSKSGSHTLTAQPVGSKSGSHTLTAQPMGSKSGSHRHTAQPTGSRSMDPMSVVPFHGRAHSPISQAILPFRHHLQSSNQNLQEGNSQAAQEQEEDEDKGGEEEEHSWDGNILSEQELEELAETMPEQDNVVVRMGSEFFDGKGNFLYRL